MKKKKLKVSVSGHSSAGKGTASRGFARLHRIMYVDVGLVFRFGTYCALTGALGGLENLLSALAEGRWRYRWEGDKPWIELGDRKLYPELVCPEISEMTARASARAEFFKAFQSISESVLSSYDGVIADGRSLGTVIMPDADRKFFITAALATRGERRMKEYAVMGFHLPLEKVMEGLSDRDSLDSSRELDPLRVPEGSVVIDTTSLNVDEVVSRMSDCVQA